MPDVEDWFITNLDDCIEFRPHTPPSIVWLIKQLD